MKNWAGNITYQAKSIFAPNSLEELSQHIRQHKKIRVLGTRHAFNTIADPGPDGTLISLENFNRLIQISTSTSQSPTVTVEGGITYAQLCPQLDHAGFALHNLASLPHISIAGACATATHGSGNQNANLAAAVVAMKIMSASGEIQNISPQTCGDRFSAMVVGLGAFGPVIELTLRLQPRFDCHQKVWLNLPMDSAITHFNQIMSTAYSVSLFTDWNTNTFNQVWCKHRADDPSPNELFGATPASKKMHPIGSLSAESCTDQMDLPGPWHERLPHFRSDRTPSSGDELQSEFFVPRENAGPAIAAIYELQQQITPLILISEIRIIAADQFLLSPCFNRDCAAIHFTWKNDTPAVMALLPVIQKALAPFNAVPHWGKLFSTQDPQWRKFYSNRFELFKAHALQTDPAGKFANDFLRQTVFAH